MMTFGGRSKLEKTSSHASSVEVFSSTISEEAGEPKLSKNSQQRQCQINQQATCISNLDAQNQKLSQLLEPKILEDAIMQAVVSNLNISKDSKSSSSSSGYIGKPTWWQCPVHLNCSRCGWIIRFSINLLVL